MYEMLTSLHFFDRFFWKLCKRSLFSLVGQSMPCIDHQRKIPFNNKNGQSYHIELAKMKNKEDPMTKSCMSACVGEIFQLPMRYASFSAMPFPFSWISHYLGFFQLPAN